MPHVMMILFNGMCIKIETMYSMINSILKRLYFIKRYIHTHSGIPPEGGQRGFVPSFQKVRRGRPNPQIAYQCHEYQEIPLNQSF